MTVLGTYKESLLRLRKKQQGEQQRYSVGAHAADLASAGSIQYFSTDCIASSITDRSSAISNI